MTEQKRGRGRPENNDNEVLTAILNNEDKRKEFVEAIENLVYRKRKIEADMLLHKEDVSAVSVRLAQSPIIFTVSENTPVYTSSSFQYVGNLYYWTGSMQSSASLADYTLVKFPNNATVGIFDLNRIINSTLTDLAIQNPSNVKYFAMDFYWQYLSGSVYVTGSHVKSETYKALDGYGVFQEPIGQNITASSAHWPLMTSGPATQSAFLTNKGTTGVWGGANGSAPVPTKIVYTSDIRTADYSVSFTTASSAQIAQYPIGPAQSGFPLSGSFSYFTTQAYSGSTALGLS